MSGWLVRELPASVDEALIRRGVPPAAIPHIKLVAEIYRGERDNDEKLTPSETRADIDRLDNLVLGLKGRLDKLPASTADAIFNASYKCGRGGALDAARKALSELDTVLAYAWQRTEPKDGRPGSGRTFLAAEIASALEQHGVEPTSRPNGPLCQALGIIFGAIEEKGRAGREEPNAVEVAKTALQWRKNRGATA